jgi:hypothetical protein
VPPGAPMISGRERIKKFWSDLVQSVNTTSAVLASVDVIPAGDGVVEIGRATLAMERRFIMSACNHFSLSTPGPSSSRGTIADRAQFPSENRDTKGMSIPRMYSYGPGSAARASKV